MHHLRLRLSLFAGMCLMSLTAAADQPLTPAWPLMTSPEPYMRLDDGAERVLHHQQPNPAVPAGAFNPYLRMNPSPKYGFPTGTYHWGYYQSNYRSTPVYHRGYYGDKWIWGYRHGY